ASAGGDDQQLRTLENRLERIRKSCEWGDKPEAEYLAERTAIRRQMQSLQPVQAQAIDLQALASILRDVKLAWDVAEGEERNQLARTLLEDIRVLGRDIIAVKPHEAFAPFFRLNYEHWLERESPRHQEGDGGYTSGGSDGGRSRTLDRLAPSG